MLSTNCLERRRNQRTKSRRLFLERLEARNQPAVLAGAGLAVKEFFAYTGTTYPTDMPSNTVTLGANIRLLRGSACSLVISAVIS